MPADQEKLLAALADAGAAGLTQTQISRQVFAKHRTHAQLTVLLEDLMAAGRIDHSRETTADKPTIRWRLQEVNSPDRTESRDATGDASSAPIRPPGDGWVPWKDVVYITEAGVPRGYALRHGQRLRERLAAHRKKTEKVSPSGISDELRGIRHIAGEALRAALTRGFIERQGDWCRLLKNPITSQRPWMEAAYSILGQAHPTLTGEWRPKPAKTLAAVMEEHLGRRLLPEEYVKRRPGCAGSWDPQDMTIQSRLLKPSNVEQTAQALAEYQERVAQAPRLHESPRFKVSLPKDR